MNRDRAILVALLASACTSGDAAHPSTPAMAGTGAAGHAGAAAGANATPPVAGSTAGNGGTIAMLPAGQGASGAAGEPAPMPREDSGTDAGTSMPDAAMMPPQTCATPSSLPSGDSMQTLEHGGRARRYLVHVPSNLRANVPVPLVLDFHGNGSSASQEAGGSGWVQKADAEGFIAVHPEGIGRGWNVGNCCGEALSGNVDDVGFAKAIVAAVSKAACIDPKRVYATGISNGAGLAHRLACEAADVFAAIAAASADLVTDPCTPARPISELSVRGLNDRLVAYEGGNTGSTGWYSPGAKMTLELWKGINGCTSPVNTEREHCETYTGCRNGVEVTLCSLPGTGHILYDNALNFDVAAVAWELFERQPMR